MPIHDHQPSLRGGAFLWGGIGLGLVLAALAHPRIRIAGRRRQEERGTGADGSPGGQDPRSRGLGVAQPLDRDAGAGRAGQRQAGLAGGGRIRSGAHRRRADAARRPACWSSRWPWAIASTRARCWPSSIRRISAQAYDDNDKAADAFKLDREESWRARRSRTKLGAASDQDLDQARSDRAQAAAEYTRTQARLKMLGVSADAKSADRAADGDGAGGRQHHDARRSRPAT